MRLFVLSPQDSSSEACLGVLVTGSTLQQALRVSPSRHRPPPPPQAHRNAWGPWSVTPDTCTSIGESQGRGE